MKTAAIARRAANRAAVRLLIAAKSVAPGRPPDYVARPRLEAALDKAVTGKLTVLCAPAGSGKTALLAAWAARRDDVAWLALDEFDNDLSGLWAYLIAALARATGSRPRTTPGRPQAALVAALTGWLSRLEKPVVLVLDNAESLTEPPARAMVAALLRPGLPNLRLVFASRRPLPLQVGRLRLDGEVTEIGAADLAFTAEEADADLVARTDGLAAAIRLGAQGDSLDAFVRSEIFLPLAEQDRDFLLQTSVVAAMSPGLAASLTQRRDAGSVLERLLQEGLARRVDPDRLRVCRFLLDFVRREARIVLGEELAKRHLWAAQWFADHGQPLAAARHAGLAEDWPLAAEIAIRHAAPDLFGANAFELREILAALPAAEAGHHPEIAAGIALLGVDRGDLDAAEAYGGLARQHLATVPAKRAMPLRAVLDLVTLMVAQRREDFRAIENAACAVITRLKGPEGCLVPTAARLCVIALAALGTVRLWAGRIGEARAMLTRALGSDLTRVSADAQGKLALLQAIRGDVRPLGESTVDTLEARVALGLACWLRGDNEAALGHLPADPTTAAGLLLVTSLRARILMSQRNAPAARAALAGAEGWVSGEADHALLDDWLATTRAALHLAEGRPINALTALNGALAERDSPLNQQAQILAARAYVASSAPARAVNLVDAARRSGLAPWPAVEAWLVSAVAAEQLGRDGMARIALAEAVAAADASGLAQPLIDAGPPLRALLEANPDLLAGRESLNVTGQEPKDKPRLVEPITEREADVLRYLPTLLRRSDIARELSVSSNTVKAHVRSIYHKLGVGSRRDAVDRARALGLLR